MISRDELIKEALYSVGGESLAHDFEKDQSDRLNIYKIYETAVRYITEICKMPLLVKTGEAVANPTLGDGWYFMPYDFVSWFDKRTPALAYEVDQSYKYSVKLSGPQIKYYAYFENITSLDPFFKQAVKWQLLSELKAVDSSIIQYSQLIDTEKNTNIQRLRTKTKFYNIYMRK